MEFVRIQKVSSSCCSKYKVRVHSVWLWPCDKPVSDWLTGGRFIRSLLSPPPADSEYLRNTSLLCRSLNCRKFIIKAPRPEPRRRRRERGTILTNTIIEFLREYTRDRTGGRRRSKGRHWLAGRQSVRRTFIVVVSQQKGVILRQSPSVSAPEAVNTEDWEARRQIGVKLATNL